MSREAELIALAERISATLQWLKVNAAIERKRAPAFAAEFDKTADLIRALSTHNTGDKGPLPSDGDRTA